MALRVGVIGLVHDHVWSQFGDWETVAEAKIVAIADANRSLWSKVRLERSQPAFYASWREMLDVEALDAVVITTQNNAALPVVEAAVARRLPIMLEKPLAASMTEGRSIYDAATGSGKVFFVNWFTHWIPSIRTAIEIAKRGDIGRIQYFRFRIGHAGPREIGCSPEFYGWLYDPVQNGGGALADFGGYGACMAAYLLGAPQGVYGLAGRYAKTDIAVEDNGLLTLRYDKAVAVCEGSWTQLSKTEIDGPIIHGDKGSVSVVDDEVLLTRSLTDGAEVVELMALPAHERSGPAYFAHCIATNSLPDGMFSPIHSLVAQRCIDAGYGAVAAEREVPF